MPEEAPPSKTVTEDFTQPVSRCHSHELPTGSANPGALVLPYMKTAPLPYTYAPRQPYGPKHTVVCLTLENANPARCSF